jgi:hypothetical protein
MYARVNGNAGIVTVGLDTTIQNAKGQPTQTMSAL